MKGVRPVRLLFPNMLKLFLLLVSSNTEFEFDRSSRSLLATCGPTEDEFC